MQTALAALMVASAGTALSSAPKPHIIWTLIDDWGWADVGVHAEEDSYVRTPHFDRLFKDEGFELGHNYVHQRSSVLTGRLPVHCNVDNGNMMRGPPTGDVCAGAPRNMTMIAAKLKEAGYQTHAIGKFDAGMCSFESTPKGRGFDTSLIYFQHANNYYDQVDDPCNKTGMQDLWRHNDLRGIPEGPAYDLAGNLSCNPDLPHLPYPENMPHCKYEDQLLADEVYGILEAHDPEIPLFLYFTPHVVHEPLMVPKEYYEQFQEVEDESRRRYLAMVHFIDAVIGNVTQRLKDKGMWEKTAWFLSSDNGGPIYGHNKWPNNQTWYAGACNNPRRGGKVSNWQGGIHVNAMVSGGFLPSDRVGTVATDMTTSFDWYATSCALAGVDPTDTRAAAAGLPPIDSMNLWPWISGQEQHSPRTVFEIGQQNGTHGSDQPTVVQGIVVDDREAGTRHKLLINKVNMDVWTGPNFPNATSRVNPSAEHHDCGDEGCLFDLLADPNEHHDVAEEMPEIRKKLREMVRKAQAAAYQPNRGKEDSPLACKAAVDHWKGFWGPWVGVVEETEG